MLTSSVTTSPATSNSALVIWGSVLEPLRMAAGIPFMMLFTAFGANLASDARLSSILPVIMFSRSGIMPVAASKRPCMPSLSKASCRVEIILFASGSRSSRRSLARPSVRLPSVESCPLRVWLCFCMPSKNLPPSLVARRMDSVISSTLIVPLLMRSYRLAMLSPVRSEISCRGLNPPFQMLSCGLFIPHFSWFPMRSAYLFTFSPTKKQPCGCLSTGQVSRARG